LIFAKKQTPTGNLWEFYQKRGAESGNFAVNTPNIFRKARKLDSIPVHLRGFSQ